MHLFKGLKLLEITPKEANTIQFEGVYQLGHLERSKSSSFKDLS